MFGRAVAGAVTAMALLAASVAWAGWVYLHTVADPTRSDRIAHAILGNPSARHEVAVDISDSLAGAADKALAARHVPATVDGADPALQGAVDAALADPNIAANIVDAITAEHAQALGAPLPHPAAINTALLLTSVRAHLAPVDPQLARSLPAVAPAQVRLPAIKIPFARQARQWAHRWVHVLALVAVAGLLLALLVGDRAAVVRRAGAWAIGAGLSWAVLPPLAVWAGDRWATSQAAVIRAIVRGATGGVTTAALALVAGGAAAVAVSFVVPRVARPRARPAHLASPPLQAPAPSAGGGWAPPTAAPSRSTAPPRQWATDTWAPSGPRTEEVPVLYDRTGRLASRPPVGPAEAPAQGVAHPGDGPLSAPPPPAAPTGAEPDGLAPGPTGTPAAPPPARQGRRPGVSRPYVSPARDGTNDIL